MRLSPAVETGSMHCLDSFTAHFMLSGGGAGRGGGGGSRQKDEEKNGRIRYQRNIYFLRAVFDEFLDLSLCCAETLRCGGQGKRLD